MTPGRKPKPVELKLIEGNRGKRRLPEQPHPQTSAPEPPAGLSQAARREWERLVPELLELGFLHRVDRGGLHRYCEAYARACAADRYIHKYGVIVTTSFGKAKNPAVQIARDASAEMKAWCAEFGMTPSSRGRMALPQDEEDELERLIAPPARR